VSTQINIFNFLTFAQKTYFIMCSITPWLANLASSISDQTLQTLPRDNVV